MTFEDAGRMWKGHDRRTAAVKSNSRAARLTEADVRAIKSQPGVSARVLAERYGVGRQQISAIRTGRAWSHVKVDKENLS